MRRKADARPIFIVSSPRSGSTLLRLILDTHPRLAIPPPGHLFHLIFPYLYSYGNVSEEANLRTLVEDVLEAPTIKRWPIKFSVEQILAGVREPSFAAVYEYLHVAYAESQG
ncbi:MAG: sulfotransferase, partial [Candidatus Hodarchaeota archaeon]